MPANSPWSTVLFIALMVAAFYLLIMRPQRKRQQALQQTLSSLEPGVRVMLTSGLFGTVVSMGSRQAVLEVSPGVELTVLKQAIARVATAADEDGLDEDGLDEDGVVEDGVFEDGAAPIEDDPVQDLPPGSSVPPRPTEK